MQTGAINPRAWVGSIRARVVVGYVVLLGVALLTMLVIVRGALLSRYDQDVDARLAAEVAQLQVVVEEGDPATGSDFVDPAVLFDTHLQRVLPADDDAFFTIVDGSPFKFSFAPPARLLDDDALVAAWASVESSEFTTVGTEMGTARVLVVPVTLDGGDGTFVAAAFTDPGRQDLNDVFTTVAGVGLLVLVASAIVALLIASRIVQPIRRLTAVTAQISDDDLSRRIPVLDGSADEVVELSSNFNAMMERLENGFAVQRRFVDDVAHELRTPITIIQGHLDLLGAVGDDPAERAETIDLLTDELMRMNRYVDDLLVLAQAERPDFVRPEPTSIPDLVDSWRTKLRSLGDRRWTVETDADGEASVDGQRLTQAILNLGQNAVRHTETGDVIDLEVERCDDRLVIAMRDSGEGIAPEVVDDLFERHIRSASSRTGGGIGLGLSIVDAVAVAHGGAVTASTSPSGAVFTIDLPVNGPVRSSTAVSRAEAPS